MAGKYASNSNPTSGLSVKELNAKYDIHVESERRMVGDNLSKLDKLREQQEEIVNELIDSMPSTARPGSMTYEAIMDDINFERDRLENIDESIRAHYALEETLTDMGEMMDALQKGNLPDEVILNTMDTLNERRNNLRDRIEDTGYVFW